MNNGFGAAAVGYAHRRSAQWTKMHRRSAPSPNTFNSRLHELAQQSRQRTGRTRELLQDSEMIVTADFLEAARQSGTPARGCELSRLTAQLRHPISAASDDQRRRSHGQMPERTEPVDVVFIQLQLVVDITPAHRFEIVNSADREAAFDS